MLSLLFQFNFKPAITCRVTTSMIATICALLILGCYHPNHYLAGQPTVSFDTTCKKVLTHYSLSPTDSLKYKAAVFLLSNMKSRYFFESSQLNDFYYYCQHISDDSEVSVNKFKNEISSYYSHKQTLTGNLQRKEDSDFISAEYLIKNIDQAFAAFDHSPWKKDVSFDDFCEYILSYRINDEKVSDYRENFYKEYITDRFRNYSISTAADSILKQTSRKGMFLVSFPDYIPNFPANILKNLRGGTCVESSSLSIYIMRSAGLPVAQDFTPQWPQRAGRHTWSALLINKDSSIDFEGVNAPKVGGHILLSTSNKLAKVFRRTFSAQKESLSAIHEKEDIPAVFLNPYMKDVSANYFSGANISVKLNSDYISQKFVYLNVFDNHNWQPVAWASVTGGSALFKNIGKGIVYLPTEFIDGKYIPVSSPFLVDELGRVDYLIANPHNIQSVKLYRKYPIFDWWDSRTLAMRGGQFQAANLPDFSDAKTIYTIQKAPELKFHIVKVKENKYRYWRYLAQDSSYGEMAELEFYNHGQLTKGTIIGTKTVDSNNEIQTAFDRNKLTFFRGDVTGNNWIGMDFKSPVKIDVIKFLGRNDGNFINNEDMYELFYWRKNKWESLGKKRGNTSQMLRYNNVPVNALLLLSDLSQGSEERIFTYSNNRQKWW